MAQFWKTFPLSLVIESKFNRNIFQTQEFNRNTIELPPNFIHIILSGLSLPAPLSDIKQITRVREFLKKHFGAPPNTPILDIPENHLLPSEDHIIIIETTLSKEIIGCIRYHYLGEFITSPIRQIYCVDCFCIHPDYRKKGLGDFLLTTLHNFANRLNIPFSLFLKEGPKLSIIHTPLYSSRYVYRKLSTFTSSPFVFSLSPTNAFQLMDIYRKFIPYLCIIRNSNTDNQKWLLYKNKMTYVLVCFQDTFQWFLDKDGKKNKIVWITAWFESSGLTDDCREEASKQLSDYLAPEFQYIWMNKEWCSKKSSIWKDDGAFHWYTYQWCSSAKITKSYCIMT